MADKKGTNPSRSDKYVQNMRDRGFTQTKVWVPADRVADIQAAAKQMREEKQC